MARAERLTANGFSVSPHADGFKDGLRKPLEVVERLQADLSEGTSNLSRTFRGFFNETLTPALATTMRPATLIDVDSDVRPPDPTCRPDLTPHATAQMPDHVPCAIAVSCALRNRTRATIASCALHI